MVQCYGNIQEWPKIRNTKHNIFIGLDFFYLLIIIIIFEMINLNSSQLRMKMH